MVLSDPHPLVRALAASRATRACAVVLSLVASSLPTLPPCLRSGSGPHVNLRRDVLASRKPVPGSLCSDSTVGLPSCARVSMTRVLRGWEPCASASSAISWLQGYGAGWRWRASCAPQRPELARTSRLGRRCRGRPRKACRYKAVAIYASPAAIGASLQLVSDSRGDAADAGDAAAAGAE